MTARTRADDLLTLLEDERRALRTGTLDGLDDRQRRKAALVAEIERDAAPVPAATLRRIRSALERNAGLLGAAADGIGRARARIAEIVSGERGLGTYAADGQKSEIGLRRPSFETKA